MKQAWKYFLGFWMMHPFITSLPFVGLSWLAWHSDAASVLVWLVFATGRWVILLSDSVDDEHIVF